MEAVQTMTSQFYNVSLAYINMAFVLAAALAWNEVIRFMISKMIKVPKHKLFGFLMYAILTTIIAVLVFQLTKTLLKGDIMRPQPIIAIT